MRIPVAATIVAACLPVACTNLAGDVTEPLTSSPVPASTGPVTTAVQDPAIAIETPFVEGDVATPVSVTEMADVVDAAFTVRVLGEDGDELAAIVVKASCGDGCRGTFATELSYFVERSQPGTIEVTGVGADGDSVLSSVQVELFPP